MRYESRAPIVLTAILGSIASVTLAWVVTVSTGRVALPVVLLNEEPLGLAFLALPVAAVMGVGLTLERSRRTLWVAGVFTALLTTALALVVWIGWVLIECGENLERCVR
jgi:hypothetical protein